MWYNAGRGSLYRDKSLKIWQHMYAEVNMRGYLYSIRAPGSDLIYYGSTIQALSQRMGEHRAQYKRHKAGKIGCLRTSFELLALPDAYIELVRIVEYTVRAELLAAEGALIRENQCVNKNQAGRTAAQYRIDHVEEKAGYDAAYYVAHTEEQKAVKHDCRCGGCYTTAHTAHHLKTIKHQTWLATQ